ncbi:MAG TPA: OmpA family protein [Burkholderiaceae bacterium]|nr:OmpA family protein [Burkholderiaceae bacterium]
MGKVIACTAAAVFALSACSSMDESQQRTAKTTGMGAAAGAAVGAIAGGSDHRGTGAAIGAAIGALGGYVWSQRMENQRKDIETATQGTGVEVQKTQDNRLKVMIPGDISFDPGRADIKPNFRPVLDQFAQSLVQNPGSVIQIVGHTDASGNDAANVQLSRERANATRDYLVSRGVTANRITTDGRGEREPLASNDTESGRARNRRVEIFVQENPA